jgi:signal transduction histidine kinase
MLDVADSPVTRFAQEVERRRIARELHDSVVQSLTTLVADLEYFRIRHANQLANDETGQQVVAKLEIWQALARDSLTSIRQALGELRRQQDPDFDMRAAMVSLVSELQAAGYTVICECDEWPARLPFEYLSNLYYIVREAVTNIYKHAYASRISFCLSVKEYHLHISIADDGVGMKASSLIGICATQSGYQQGLIGIRERVMLLGGQLSIESTPGSGTSLNVDVPLPHQS